MEGVTPSNPDVPVEEDGPILPHIDLTPKQGRSAQVTIELLPTGGVRVKGTPTSAPTTPATPVEAEVPFVLQGPAAATAAAVNQPAPRAESRPPSRRGLFTPDEIEFQNDLMQGFDDVDDLELAPDVFNDIILAAGGSEGIC